MCSAVDPSTSAFDAGAAEGTPSGGDGPAPADAAALYLLCFTVVGLSIGILGPSVSALREQVGVGTGSIGAAFAAEGAGYLIGSLASAQLYDRGGGHRVLTGALCGLAVALAMVPLVGSLNALVAVYVLVGTSAGTLDVGCNSMVVWSRGPRVGPLMGALHLCFGIGALVAPILAHVSIATRDDLRLGYWAVAAFALALAVFAPRFAVAAAPGRVAHRDESRHRTPWLIVMAAAAWFLLYVAVEVGFASWLHTYAEDIDIGGATAATALNVAYWAAFTLGRLATVLVARRRGPIPLLPLSGGAAVVAAVALLLADGAAAAVWPAVVLYGLAVAPQFPMMISHVGEHVVLSARATSLFVGAAGLSSLTFPWLIGRAMDSAGPAALPRAATALTIGALGWFFVVHRLATGRRVTLTRPGG